MERLNFKFSQNYFLEFSVLIILSLIVSGCAMREAPTWKPDKHNEIHPIANKQLPPEPIYNPVRWVRPPEVTPARKADYKPSNKIISLVYSFTVKDSTIEKTSLALANALGYRSYCSSLIAEQPFSLELLGTIDEIANTISKKAGIKVVLDHDNKEVRFLTKDAVVPQFAEKQ